MKRTYIGIIVLILIILGVVVYYSNLLLPTSPKILSANLDVSVSPGLGLLIAECGNESFLFDTADFVTVGTVNNIEQTGKDKYGRDLVLVVVSVEEYLKGTGPQSVNIRIPGILYQEGYTLSQTEDGPDFELDEKLKLYIEELPGEESSFGEPYSVVCGAKGKVVLESSGRRPEGPYIGPV